MISFDVKDNYTVNDLLAIMTILRGPDGCPWDKEQNHSTIRMNMLEEAYEAAEAIDLNNDTMLCEELGDVLLQVVFHSQMAKERGAFDFNGVCDGICKKLIERHPHIFGDVKADTSEQVLTNWAQIKKQEKGQRSTADVMNGVAKSLPALMRGQKVAKAAVKAGIEQRPEVGDNAADKVCALLWDAVKLSYASGLDAEEEFTKFINAYIEKQK